MFAKTIRRLVTKFGVDPSRVVCGVCPDDYKQYQKACEEFGNKVHLVKERKIGIGPAREKVRRVALKLFPNVSVYLWLDDKTTVHRGLWRGAEILRKDRKAGIVCGVSSIMKFFAGDSAGKNEKLWGATLMWVRPQIMKACKFLNIRCYEDKAFMLGAIRKGWHVVNDYKMEYSGPRHLEGGTASHGGLQIKHIKYALRIIKRETGDLVSSMKIREKKKEKVFAISFKYPDKVQSAIRACGL